MNLIRKFSKLFAVLSIMSMAVWSLGCGNQADTGTGGTGGTDTGAVHNDDHGDHDHGEGSTTGGGIDDVPHDDDIEGEDS